MQIQIMRSMQKFPLITSNNEKVRNFFSQIRTRQEPGTAPTWKRIDPLFFSLTKGRWEKLSRKLKRKIIPHFIMHFPTWKFAASCMSQSFEAIRPRPDSLFLCLKQWRKTKGLLTRRLAGPLSKSRGFHKARLWFPLSCSSRLAVRSSKSINFPLEKPVCSYLCKRIHIFRLKIRKKRKEKKSFRMSKI